MNVEQCQKIMCNLIVNLSIADHLGDASEDVMEAAKQMQCQLPTIEPGEDNRDMVKRLIDRGHYGLRGCFRPEDKVKYYQIMAPNNQCYVMRSPGAVSMCLCHAYGGHGTAQERASKLVKMLQFAEDNQDE